MVRAAERRCRPTSNVADAGQVAGLGGGPGGQERRVRDEDLDRRALVGDALAAELRADAYRPGAHAGEAQVAVGNVGRIEPAAVVDDPQPDPALDRAQLEPDLLCTGVLDDVVERLLGDPVE